MTAQASTPATVEMTASIAGEQDAAASAKKLRRAILASLVDNTLEWYDFFLYGTAAALSVHSIPYIRYIRIRAHGN